MNRLKRVRASGSKSIREMDLELGSINVLIGANGAGKSNLPSLFGMLSYAMSGSLQIWVGENGWADSILHFGAAGTPQMTVDLEYETDRGDNLYHARLVHAAADALMFADEAAAFAPDGQGAYLSL